MTISDEVVEAAMDAFVGAGGTLRDRILAILGSAAPHMLAEVWEVAYQSALEDEGMDRVTTHNPHRPTL